jgi:hypothetical protein
MMGAVLQKRAAARGAVGRARAIADAIAGGDADARRDLIDHHAPQRARTSGPGSPTSSPLP